MTGDLGYFQFGLDSKQLQLLEQNDVHFKTLCNIFDVPWQLFGNADSYENRKQYKRDFVYDNIAVAAYSLRDELNAKLIKEFNLDRDRDVIDVDILALPELGEDLKDQIGGLTQALDRGMLTPNEARQEIGYDVSTDPNMEKFYITSSLTPLDQLNEPIGGGLESDLNALND